MNLTEFISSEHIRNQWISEPHLRAYVRRSNRLIEGKSIKCFDLASIEVDHEHWNKGHLTHLLRRLKEEQDLPIYVESILNPAVTNVCRKEGFIIQEREYDVIAYYGVKPESLEP